MHSLLRHGHNRSRDKGTKKTRGLVLNSGWWYDAMETLFGGILFHGKLADLRHRTAELAQLQSGEVVLDVGCGTGTLAIEAQQIVGESGRVCGIDPGEQQIAQARSKASQRKLPVDFRVGVIESLPFPDETFDVVLSTIMMHHLGDGLKRQGLAEISRVLKPDGRLVIADFKRPEEHQARAQPFGSVRDLRGFVEDAGFSQVVTEEMPFPRFSGGVVFVRALRGPR